MVDPVPTTDNHELPKIPPLDSTYDDEWGYILNEGEFSDESDAGTPGLIPALEERLIVRTEEANRTNFTAHEDALLLATDTGAFYEGDGTNWNLVGLELDALDVDGVSIPDDLIHEDEKGSSNGVATLDGDAVLHTNQLPENAIGTSELDLSISPTWTGEHTFEDDIDLNDNHIRTVGNIYFDDEGEETFNFFTINDELRLRDRVRNTDIMRWDSDGFVRVVDSDLRLDTGQAIEDGGGVERFSIRNSRTVLRDEQENEVFRAEGQWEHQLRANEGIPFTLRDTEGNFTAFEYNTTSSAPGTLEATNANLDMAGNDIEDAGSVTIERASIAKNSASCTPESQTISNDTLTQLEFVQQYDNLGVVNETDNQFDIQDDGYYIFIIELEWDVPDGSMGDTVDYRLYVNNSFETLRRTGFSFEDNSRGIEKTLYPAEGTLFAGDTVHIEVRQDTGESVEIIDTNSRSGIRIQRVG